MPLVTTQGIVLSLVWCTGPLASKLAADRYIPLREFVSLFRCLPRWTVPDLKDLRNRGARGSGTTRQPFFVLKMSEFFRHSDIYELVERDPFLLRNDPQFASNSGRPGHWGLIGMRERTQKIGATLRAQRSTKSGTEIELRVAARLAYLATGKGLSRFLFRRNQG